VEIRPAADDGEAWDRFVRASRGWTHCHLYGWRSVIESTFGHECSYLTAVHDGALAGVLPLVRVRSSLFGHYLVSMPFLNYGGPLGEDTASAALVDAAIALADESGAELLELRSRHELPVSVPVSHRKIAVVRELPSESDELWHDLRAKVRSQIRRPKKEGVEVRFGADQIGPFFRVFSHHMRDLGTPALPESFFTRIGATFSDSVWYGCAYLGEQPIAAGCAFRWDGELEMTWASALREHNRIAPNMLLYWAFMERAIETGLRSFNFGRCTPGGGTHRFKSQWGGGDETLWWYDHAAGGRTATPSAGKSAYGWGQRLWRLLPLPIARRLGPRIVKYIP
jgi:FemAB-related protein (PEP-CTERM system-associated)